jgi:hypothetical protein
MEICRTVEPASFLTDDATTVACHLHTTGPTLAGQPVTVLSENARTGNVGNVGNVGRGAESESGAEGGSEAE